MLWYYFGTYGSDSYTFTATSGTYTFNVPQSHPIAFYTAGTTNSYSGGTVQGTKNGQDGNSYDYRYGTVTLTINDTSATPVTYECYFHGYMGGLNNLILV